MKTLLLWAFFGWLSLLSFGARAQVTLAQETFEVPAGSYGYSSNAFTPLSTIEYFYRQQLNASGAAYTGTTQPLTSQQGSFAWTGEGVRGTGQTNDRPAGYVVLNPITNSASYKNFVITVLMAAPRGGTFAGAGANSAYATDRIRIQYSFNGGAWTTAAMLMGNNAITPGTAGNGGDFQQLASLADSTNVSNGSSPPGSGPVLDQMYRDITATLPATALGANLRVRVVLDTKLVEVTFDNIRVTGVLDNTPKPTLNTLETESASYTEGGSPVPLTSSLTVGYSDNSSTNITSATVSVSGAVAGQDVLTYSTLNGIVGNTPVLSGGVLTLTLTNTATQTDYRDAIRSIRYSNSNTTTLASSTRALSFTAFNGTTSSGAATRTLTITPVLNAPTALNYTESFDTDGEGTRYFGNSFINIASQVGFFRATTSPATSGTNTIGTNTFTGWSGGYWFGEGNDNANNPSAPTSTLQLAPVNTSGRVNLKFTIALATSSNWLGYFDAANPGDSFELYYRINGGSPVKFGAFYGVTGSTAARQDADLDRTTPATGTLLTSALQDITFNLPAAAAVGNLDFLLVQQSRGTSELAFDNIRITGTALPTVTTTTPATNLTATSATLGGTVTADGGGTLAERGVVYVVGTGTPTTSNTKAVVATSGIVVGTAFSGTVSSLTGSTQYTARAYAINEAGTSYGANVTFTTLTPTTVTSLVRTSPVAALTNATSVVYTVTFGTAVTGLTAANFSLTTTGSVSGATVGAPTVSAGNTWTVPVNAGTGSGTLTLNLANDTNLSADITTTLPFAGETYTIDKTAPVVSSVVVPANGSYKAGQTLSFTVNFSEAVTVTGIPQLALTIGSTNRQAVYASGSGSTALVFNYPLVNGDLDTDGIALGALALNGGTVRDAAGNNATLTLNNVPSTAGVLVDAVAPTVTISSSAGNSGSTTGTTPIPFAVTFSENVTGFAASGVTVSNGTLTGFVGSGATYTFSVTPTTPGTPTTVNVPANGAQDAAGNFNSGATPFSLTYNAPTTTVASVTRLTLSPTATAQVSYRVVFAASVTGVTVSTFTATITSGIISGASVSSVSGSGTTYTVTVNTGTGDGILRLDVANSTGITPTITNVPYTAGETYTITKSFPAAPTLRIQAAGSASGNGDVTAFVDVVQVLSGGTAVANALQNTNFETNNVAAGSYLYAPTVVAAPWSFGTQAGVSRNGPGGFGSTAAAGDAVAFLQSAGGNNGSVSQNLAVPTGSYQINFQTIQRNYTALDQRLNVFVNDVFVGSIQPNNIPTYEPFTSASFNVFAPALTATVSTTSASPTSTTPIPFSVSFSQNVGTTFTAADVTVTGGTLTTASFSGSGPGPYTFTVTPNGPGTVSVSVAASVAADANNTLNTATNTVSVLYQAPSIVLSPATLPDGTVATAYSQTLSASGGIAPYSYALTAGALPTGLTLTSAGVLSGTLTAAGSFNFTVTATDASAAPGPYSGSRAYSLTIAYPDLVISTSGQKVPAGTYNSITVQRGGVGTLAGNVLVNRDVTVQSGGTLSDGCALLSGPGSFTLAAGGTLSICSAQGISSSGATGTVQVTGTRSFSPDALYTYNGTLAQVTGTGLPATVRALTLNNPAGLSLTNSLLTTTAATFPSGVLTTGANTLTLGSGATLSEDVDGYVTGTVLATRSLATAGSPEAFGGLGLMLTPSGSILPGSTLVRRVTGTALRGAGTSTSIQRYFDIQPTVNSGLNVALVLTARDDERNGIAPANLRLFKSADNGSSWQPQAATYSTATVSGLTTYSASLSGISDFSLWTLGDASSPLPVTLTSFQALLQDETQAVLRWATASELHSAYFAVERSLDGRTFVEVGRVAAAGTSLLAHSYELRDPLRLTGLTYYRLRQVDTDRSATYSPVVSLSPSMRPGVQVSIYPNPRRGTAATSVEVRGLATQQLTILVTDMLGRTVSTQEFTPPSYQAAMALRLPDDLAAGVYSVSVSAGQQTWTTRLIVAP